MITPEKVEYYIQDAALHELNHMLWSLGLPQLTNKSFNDWVYELARKNIERRYCEWFDYEPEEDPTWHEIIMGMQMNLNFYPKKQDCPQHDEE